MNEQLPVSDSKGSEVWYACFETNKDKIWTCQGPYNNVQLADDFFKERLNAHTTMLINTPSYLPPFIRERVVSGYILEKHSPKIFFTKPEDPVGNNSAPSLSRSPQVEWAAH